jgi:hypothetical protein
MINCHMVKVKIPLALVSVLSILLLGGCAGVGMTLFGVGTGVTAGTSVAYTLDGVAYRTFTVSLPQVESATRTALDRMGIKIDGTANTEQGKALHATSNDRQIEIELERVSSKTTRIRAVAKQGLFFKDRATAGEIIFQTEKILGLS